MFVLNFFKFCGRTNRCRNAVRFHPRPVSINSPWTRPIWRAKSESEMVAKLENECQNWNKTAHEPNLKNCNLFEKENTCRVVVTFMPHVKHFLWKKKKRDCRQDDGRCVTSLTKLEPQCYLTANDGQACWTDCEARRAGGQILNTLFISFCPCDRGRFISHAGASSTFWRACRVTNRSETTRTKGWRTPETDSITLAGLFYFHNVVDQNGIQSCCIFAVVTVYCPYGWRHHFNIFKKGK
jgi:hypothetical protein